MAQPPNESSDARPDRPRVDRSLIATSIPGLDQILDGGLRAGDLYLVSGPPGSGKTTLGNQIAYAQAASGSVAIYATVLAETHERMLLHLAIFDFYVPNLVSDDILYVSIYDALSSGGLPAALTLLRRLVRDQRASLLVVDGASLFDDFAPSPVEFRRFTSELHAQLAALGCTILLLADEDGASAATIGFQVDGVIALENNSTGLRDVRLLRVSKLRGSNPLAGRHYFTIDRTGLRVFPRLEAVAARRALLPPPVADPSLQRFGILGLDEMVGGGLPAASTTLLIGLAGTGKTCLGLSFIIEGANQGQPGLIATLDERSPQLEAKARAIGLDLRRHIEADRIRVLWHLPLDLSLDAWASELLATIEATGARRVFIDPAGAFPEMEVFTERLSSFIAALIGELRQRGVGAVFAAEARSMVGQHIEIPPPSFPVLLDNAISLRYVETDFRLRRVVAALKVSGGFHDTSLREMVIGSDGIRVGQPIASDHPGQVGITSQGDAP